MSRKEWGHLKVLHEAEKGHLTELPEFLYQFA